MANYYLEILKQERIENKHACILCKNRTGIGIDT